MSTDLNRAPFPYPGSKARHADWILEHIPEHRTYVEPFGGAAGVLFQKPPSKVEVYNDRDGDIVQFFRVFRERPDELVEWLEAVPYARDVYDKWASEFYDEGYRPGDEIERAGRFFALRYMQFSGKLDGKAGFSVKYDVNPASQMKRKTEKLKVFADRLRNVQVENRDASECIDVFDSDETVFYCDPPYIERENLYNAEGFDHHALHDALLEAEGRAVVSYDAVPSFYGDEWDVAMKEATSQIHGGSHRDITEVLLMNFDGEGEPVMSGVGQQTLESVGD
jgi:DNA adenine methylase